MKQSVNLYDFEQAFKDHERQNNFSYEGLKALFEYLENYEEDTGSELELDVIALCCEYSEYDSLEELQKDYSDIESIEDLEDHTTVIKIEGSEGFIIQQY